MTTDIQTYLSEGCGRCSLFATPDCKVIKWNKELRALRELAVSTGMTETMKWGTPVYMVGKTNTVMIFAFKGFAAINFLKGVLMHDDAKMLVPAGENSQSAMQWRFTGLDEIIEHQELIKAYLYEAIEIERAGLKVEKKEEALVLPEELQAVLDEHPDVKAAFQKLTPGRQRSHVIFVSGAKQSATRKSRAEKNIPKILAGKGMND